MKKIVLVLYLVLGLAFLGYLLVPPHDFPNPPLDSVQSNEFADKETPLRRAYFTNLTRGEVINYYKSQFGYLPSLRLNYPPEESQTLIRDQTRSTFLEELVHPFRESLYINGFEPKEDKDKINIAGVPWRQKIIIKYVPSSAILRIVVAIPTIIMIFAVGREWVYEVGNIRKWKK